MTRSVIIKIHELRDENGYRYQPPSPPASVKSPASTLLEIVGEAFNDIAQEYNLARTQNLGEAYVPAKADLVNRKMYNQVAPTLGIDTKQIVHRPSEPIPRYQVRPRRAGDWLSGTAHKDRFHLLPTVIPLNEARLISEKKEKRDHIQKPLNYNYVHGGRIHGIQRSPPSLLQPDYGLGENRRYQRHHFTPTFERDFHSSTRPQSIVYSYCTRL